MVGGLQFNYHTPESCTLSLLLPKICKDFQSVQPQTRTQRLFSSEIPSIGTLADYADAYIQIRLSRVSDRYMGTVSAIERMEAIQKHETALAQHGAL